MPRIVMRLFSKLCEIMAWRRLTVMAMVGGLTLGLSALTGAFQSTRAPDGRVESQRKLLHDRVQRVRDALHTTEGVSVDRIVGSHLAQWYNWGNWPNGWRNYWNNWPNR